MRMGEVSSLDKSVCFWTQHGFGYGYGGKFRDPDLTNLDKGILKVSENFETDGEGKAMGIIDMRVADLLILRNDGFT